MAVIVPGHFNPSADAAVPFDVTLAVAATSETLFTVPVGKTLRSVAFYNHGEGDAFVSLTAGAAATAADTMVERRESVGLEMLDLAEGTYAFIGEAGKTPRVRGVAMVG